MRYLDLYESTKNKIENFFQIFDNSIKHNAIDKLEWDNVYKNSPKLKKMDQEGKKIFDGYITVMQDLYYMLYKHEPDFIEPNRLNKEAGAVNRSVMQDIKEMSAYDELRTYTVGDELNAAVSLVELGNDLHERVKEKAEELKRRQEELQQKLDQLKEMMQNANASSDEELSDEEKEAIQDLANDLGQAMQGIDPDIGDIADTMDSVTQMAQENEELKMKWGLDQNDSFQKMPYQQKMKTFERLRKSNKLKEVADMLGEFKKVLASEHATSVNKDVSSVQKTTHSNEITAAIPSQLLRLVDEDMEMLFMKDFANHSLETFEYEHDTEEIQGPIVIAIDESGSMMGTPEVWSKACALAVVHQAQVENRSVFVIHFSYTYSARNMKVNVFPKDKDLDINELIDMAEHFYGGGTDFNQPIERMMQCVDTEEGFERADGLFITDGYSRVEPNILDRLAKFKKDKHFKIIGIQLGGYGDEMDKFCNENYNLQELTNDLFLDVNNKLLH